jgi:Xaa-Pro aminopeptidase
MCETFARRNGHGGLLRFRHFQAEGYPWHILSGTSGGMVGMLDAPASGEGTSVAFPCGAGNKVIEADEPIMVDFGSVLNGYHVDETRMFAIGSMPEKAHRASMAGIEIHNSIIDKAKPGISLDELFSHSVSLAKQLGYAEQYLGPEGYKVSFVAHGVGIEMSEPPFIAKGKREPLEPGMTFALEPKLVFENAFAAGIESVFLVTDTGARLITKVPVEIFIVT